MVNPFSAPLPIADRLAGKHLIVVHVYDNGDVLVRDTFNYHRIPASALSDIATI